VKKIVLVLFLILLFAFSSCGGRGGGIASAPTAAGVIAPVDVIEITTVPETSAVTTPAVAATATVATAAATSATAVAETTTVAAVSETTALAAAATTVTAKVTMATTAAVVVPQPDGLEFREGGDVTSTKPNGLPLILTGSDVRGVEVRYDSTARDYYIVLTFSARGGSLFNAATERLAGTGECISIWVAGKCIAAPIVAHVVTVNECTIHGGYTQAQAHALSEKIEKFTIG